MNPLLPLLALAALCVASSLRAEALPKAVSNITVFGSVYCDACSNNTFSKHSYFLRGAKVLVECKFKVNAAASKEEMSITAERTTDRFGVYKLEVPAVDGFECRQGREVKSMCRATLVRSSSVRCDVAGLRSSAEHVAVKSKEGAACYFNLNALSYRPARRNAAQCGAAATGGAVAPPGAAWGSAGAGGASLFFWPIFPPWSSLPFPFSPLPPFLIPPSLPFPFPHVPFPDPSSLPFSIPSWLLPFLKPPYFPCPLVSTPSPPSAR